MSKPTTPASRQRTAQLGDLHRAGGLAHRGDEQLASTIGWPAAAARSVPMRNPSSIASTTSSRVRPRSGDSSGAIPDLGVDDAVGGQVLGALGGDPHDRVALLHDARRCARTSRGRAPASCGRRRGGTRRRARPTSVGREVRVAELRGEVDDRRRPQAAVEVVVEQRLGRPADRVEREHGVLRSGASSGRRYARGRSRSAGLGRAGARRPSAAATRVGAVPPMTSQDASEPSIEAAARSVAADPGFCWRASPAVGSSAAVERGPEHLVREARRASDALGLRPRRPARRRCGGRPGTGRRAGRARRRRPSRWCSPPSAAARIRSRSTTSVSTQAGHDAQRRVVAWRPRRTARGLSSWRSRW